MPSPSFSPSNLTFASPVASPSRKLARNPNGIYRWEGGGSAKAESKNGRLTNVGDGAIQSSCPWKVETSSRLRTPAKPTAPINPSVWSSTSSHEARPQPTKAANLLAELIKQTAPPNKPDLSNPYQTASPVSKVGPPRRATKRPKASGRPPLPMKEQKAEEEKNQSEERRKKEGEEKMNALSAQAIIEATLPKVCSLLNHECKLLKPVGE
jgi:hypothetical protein